MTGWLVRAQTAGALLNPLPVINQLLRGRESDALIERKRIAAAEADDFRVHLAAALLTNGDGAGVVTRLKAVRDRFPNEPAVHATVLRRMALNNVNVGHRPENEILFPPKEGDGKARSQEPAARMKNRPDDLAVFERSAAEGERLDPGNAYFPYLRAVGLYAAGRDDEGRAALARAAGRSRWDEYTEDEMQGAWALAVRAHGGEVGSLARTAVAASTLFPHYAVMRAQARLTAALAIQAELAGRTDDGFAMRRDLARVGALMRHESQTTIGSLVGQAITRIAYVTRPGGVPVPEKRSGPNSSEENKEAMVAQGCAYLQKIGHPEEAKWFRTELAAGERAKQLYFAATNDSLLGIPEVDRAMPLWAAGFLLLGNVALLLLFAGALTLARKVSPRLRAGEPLPAPAKWGLSLGVVAPPLGLYFALYSGFLPPAALVVIVLALAGFVVGVPVYARFGARGIFGGALVAVAVSLLLCVAAAYVATQAQGALVPFRMFQSLSGSGDGATLVGEGTTGQVFVAMLALLFCAAAPVLMFLTLTVLSRPLRIPASHAVARGFEALAGPVACLLLLGYAGLTVVTARHEAKAIDALGRSVQHEGRYYASVIGRDWPGPVSVQSAK